MCRFLLGTGATANTFDLRAIEKNGLIASTNWS